MPPENMEIDKTKLVEKAADAANLSVEAKDVNNLKTQIELSQVAGNFKDMYNKLTSVKENPQVKDKASESMKKIGDILNIQVPFLGSIGAVLGTRRPIEVLGSKEQRNNKKFLNGILKLFGFKNGVEDLHESYISEQIKGIDMTFAKDCFNEYKTTNNPNITEDQSTRKICEIDKCFPDLKDEQKKDIKAKVPQDFENIKKTLIKELPNNLEKLSLGTVNLVDPSCVMMQEGPKKNKMIVNTARIMQNKEEFIDRYLKFTIPILADPKDTFIWSEKVNVDTFALALFGNLTGDKFFVEGVNLGLISAPINSNSETTKTNNVEADPNQAAKIKTELNTVKNTPITPEMIISASTKYNVPTTYIMAIMKNDSSYWTAGKWAKTHNPGNVGNTDSGATKDRWTRESGVNAVAENLARRIKEYQNIYGNKMPTTKELAQNQWPDGKGFLSNQWNFKKANPDSAGAYMTSKQWQERVQDIAQNLTQEWISNERAVA